MRSSSSTANNNNNAVATRFCLSLSSSTEKYLSSTSSLNYQTDSSPQLVHSKDFNSSVSSTNDKPSSTKLPKATNKKSNQSRIRNRKKASTSSNDQALVAIASNIGQSLTTTTVKNVQRVVTSNKSIAKRSTTSKRQIKRNSKTLVQCPNEGVLQQNSSSPTNSFAKSISGLLENFDQELLASNFLSQPTTSNLLLDENNSIISSNTNNIQTSEHIDSHHACNNTLQRQEMHHSTIASMPTLDEFNERLENNAILTNQTIDNVPTAQNYNTDNVQITSFMSEEYMRLVEMNFDENTFLKQFDLEDLGVRLSAHTDQSLFANVLSNSNNNNSIETQQHQINEQLTTNQNQSLSTSSESPSTDTVFTTIVPLGLQQQLVSDTNTFTNNSTALLSSEEGVRLT